jgi:hypothetical protein
VEGSCLAFCTIAELPAVPNLWAMPSRSECKLPPPSHGTRGPALEQPLVIDVNCRPVARPVKRAVIFVHRWLGVSLCLFFLLWFPSGIGMMYWDFPGVTAGDRLERSPALDRSAIRLSPAGAYAVTGQSQAPSQVRLNVLTAVRRIAFAPGGEMSCRRWCAAVDPVQRPDGACRCRVDRTAGCGRDGDDAGRCGSMDGSGVVP